MNWLDSLEARWQAWWPELEPREQRLIGAAAALVLLALLWWVALAPALRILAAAPAEHARLDAQLQQMTTLQTQAKALQAQPRASRDDAVRALESSVRQSLGPNAQLQPAASGDGITVAVRTVPADTLAQWLAQARSNARAVPREAHLARSAQNTPGAGGAAPAAGATNNERPAVRWDGSLVMGLPPR
ncbi:General secretion pathway, M protein [Variovorax sp. PBS-H4]|uniref:type II secretion system protein GspM n=1 Tax=Variovorax sp. PBS-H4 TaxID=434008 RepID=UPI0013162940|nr:type II secretion system protein GspM [Variovorax sp. PBS-H4]VTU23726.1 General secretion pathway, M protein [Variovorax sp. PBS-H4]